MELPLVAIVGAPNVGKSTLFNRLIGRRRSIVTNEPGVTRDRIYGTVRDAPRPFRLVDTGGLTPRVEAAYARQIEGQAQAALDEAALVLFVVDARAGLTALDRELAEMLRRRGGPLLLVANKIDGEHVEPAALACHELGLGQPHSVSAEHSRGIDELIESIDRLLGPGEPGEVAPREDELRVAIVGRPNVGKSSIFNRLVGEERAVVSDIPGTTRDAVDTSLELGARRYRLIDTAGLRRRGRIQRGVDRFSSERARRNIDRCDVAVLVLDASAELAAQDTHIAGYIVDAFRPLVVVLNKWDLVEDREAQAKRWMREVSHRLRFVKQVPLLFVSALSGQRVSRILDEVDRVHASAGIEVPTAELNRFLHGQAEANPSAPPPRGSLRFYYMTQTGTHPPSFVLFCNDPRKVHFSVRRRLENGLRERFDLGSAPIRLSFRARRP
jgi:GTP-binding protein